MAKKRMFDLALIDTDSFLELPTTAQNLYFHANMRADDDGFVSNIRKIMSLSKASEDDLKILITKGFFLVFSDGIVVIRHWRINNYIRKDRYVPTIYKDKKKVLSLDLNGAYSFGIPMVDQRYTNGQPSIVKNSIVCSSNIKEEINKEEKDCGIPSIKFEDTVEVKDSDSLYTQFENFFGRALSPTEIMFIDSFDYPEDIINYALDEARLANKISIKYVNGILENWKRANVKSVEDAKRCVADFKKVKEKSNKKDSSVEKESYYKEL